MKRFALALTIPLVLAACAKINDAGMRLVTTTVPAHAVVNGTLLSGKASLQIDRSGTFSLSATEGNGLSCMGHQRYTASQSGMLHLQCSDGTLATLNFTALRESSGHARGSSANGSTASLTYGLPAAEARAYLVAPAGQRLSVAGDDALRAVSP